MKLHSITCGVAAFLLNGLVARADFQNGQSASLALGELSRHRTVALPGGVAVDPVTHKVFVSEPHRGRVLRFSSAESLLNGGAAEVVIGQPDFDIGLVNNTVSGIITPTGLAMDGSGHLWVADQFKHRVVRFDNAATAANGPPASSVLGQPTLTSGGAGLAENRMNAPQGVAVDALGRLWVADTLNHRVLRFDNAAAKPIGGNADAVLGQVNFLQNISAVSASGLMKPTCVSVESNIFLTKLWVGDGNNRVLLYNNPAGKPNGGAADKVLGQINFTISSSALERGRMHGVSGVASFNGRLWVCDSANSRVLRFDNAGTKSNGADADGVLGQSLFTTATAYAGPEYLNLPTGIAVDGERLWIADTANSRVIRHENAASKGNGNEADGVLGQKTTNNLPVSADRFGKDPKGITIDPVSGKIFVCDAWNNRVLRFGTASGLASGDAAETVLGQEDLTSTYPGTSAIRMWSPWSVAMDHLGHLWVADSGNNRVLRFDNAATLPSGSPAAHVIGQTDFVSGTEGSSSTTLKFPVALAVAESFNRTSQSWTTNRLWVADSNNHRVLRFDNIFPQGNGAFPAGVLGQTSFSSSNPGFSPSSFRTPTGLAVDLLGHLWVADGNNNRVLRFDAAAGKSNGAPANGLLLQPAYADANNQTSSASLGRYIQNICLSPTGRLYVVDFGRIVWFDDAVNRPDSVPADGYLAGNGWDGGGYSNLYSWNNLNSCFGCALDATGHLWVTDGDDHNRVLRFTPALESTISSTGLTAEKKFTLTMSALVGETYELRSSPDLLDWSTTEATFRATIGLPFGVLSWTAPTVATGKRFYRLQAP